MLVEGMIATCPIIDLEVLYSARSAADHTAILAERRAMPSFVIDEQVTDRAIAVQGLLAETGMHRLPIPGLLIAAVAELNGLTVLHYDADFDRIASVTGQVCQWVMPPGSI